jgi:predicted dehydrogenase
VTDRVAPPLSGTRVGIVGAGAVSALHAAAWRKLGASVTVHAPAGAERLAAEYGFSVASSLDGLLDRAAVVDICSPTLTHRSLALAAIRGGKHVLCEKPVTRTAADALELLEVAAKAGVQIYPGHVVRYFPEYVTAKQAVDRGRIGQLAVIRLSRTSAGPVSDWFYDEDLSGGLVMDQMIHDLDQARWLAGEVTQVYAVQNPPSVGGRLPREVVAHVTLTHAGGAISYLQGSWLPPHTVFHTTFDIAGTDGVLRFDSSASVSVTENLPPAPRSHSYLPQRTGSETPYDAEIREFATAFAGGPAPRVSISDGIIAVALAEAALTSIREHRAVEFNADGVMKEVARCDQ